MRYFSTFTGVGGFDMGMPPDQDYEAADALESHMFEFPDHAVKSAVREVSA